MSGYMDEIMQKFLGVENSASEVATSYIKDRLEDTEGRLAETSGEASRDALNMINGKED